MPTPTKKTTPWTLLLIPLLLLLTWHTLRWRHTQNTTNPPYQQQIQHAAHTYNLDPTLLNALIWQESKFNPNALGKHGEIGLMQLTPAAAYEWADTAHNTNFQTQHLYNPHTNTLAGAHYLAKNIHTYQHTDNPIPYALAAYNAGKTKIKKWQHNTATTNSTHFIQQIPYPGTKKYIQNILKRQKHYQTKNPTNQPPTKPTQKPTP